MLDMGCSMLLGSKCDPSIDTFLSHTSFILEEYENRGLWFAHAWVCRITMFIRVGWATQ
jgi:hypothetical protein